MSFFISDQQSLSDAVRSNDYLRVVITFNTIPSNVSVNLKVNPPRYFMGYATICLGDFVLAQTEIQFVNQVLVSWKSVDAQLASFNFITAKAVATDMVAFSDILSPPVKIGTLVPGSLTAASCLACPFDNVKISLSPEWGDYTLATYTRSVSLDPDYVPQWEVLTS
jgi:hypothetical protein